MANYRAVANGNWSSGATWGGGAVPPNGEGHNIYSNNFTVTIDQNVDVALITNASITAAFVGGGTSAAAGGGFAFSSSGFTLVSTNATAASVLLINNNSSAGINTLNIGNITESINSANITSIRNSSTGELIINGATMNTGRVIVQNSLSGIIRLNSCVITGNSIDNNTYRIHNLSSGNVFINGSTITTSVSTFNSYTIFNTQSGGIFLETCTISGGTLSETIRNASTGTISIVNSIVTTNSVNTINNVSSGTLIVESSTVSASNGFNAIVSTNANAVNRISATLVNSSNGTQAVYAQRWILNKTSASSYIQHALDGINANSFVRYFTADNNLGQANPTDVRNGVLYASGNLTGTLTVPVRGTIANGVTYGPNMPFTASRSGTTATATLAYSYPYQVGDVITVTGASNSEWNGDYTIASVVSGTSVTFTVPNTHSATAGTGARMQTKGTAVLDGASVAAAVWGAATRTITGGTVDTLTNAPSVPSAATIASQVRTELTSELAKISALNTTRLGNVSTVETTGAQLASALTAP